ncbi:myozenin-3-like [Arapaima gigas]
MTEDLYRDQIKQRRQQAMELSMEVQGEHLDLGKKISVPQDIMMEELNLLKNRGSRMFQERLKRVEKYTLENTGNKSSLADQGAGQTQAQIQGMQDSPNNQNGKENIHTKISVGQPAKNNLVSALKSTVSKKGSPNILAPGSYSGPLKEIPHEKFNVTVIPKSYHSPWRQDPSTSEKLHTINAQLPEPPQKLTPENYKCFNRAPIPFGGTAGSTRVLPLPGFELAQAHTEPSLTWERISKRPNFNRAPHGWHASIPETTGL